MTGSVSALMVDVQRRLETLYALPAGAPVSDFLIPEDAADRYPGDGSRTLLAETGSEVSLGVVLDRDTSRALAESDPRLKLHGENLGPFCTLAEEVSHFLYLLFCAESARHVTELELELQGEVDKYLSAVFLLSLQNEGAVSPRLRELLFSRFSLRAGLSGEQTERYRAASALAARYCGHLESRYLRGARLGDLARESRRFYRLGQREKLERIAVM